jgi:hypothetical protein
MKKVNLTKELENNVARKEKEAFENNEFITADILNQTNTLLLASHNEDQDTLSTLGIKHLQFEKNLVADVVRTDKVKKIYNKSAFTGKDIKYFCNLYDLRILRIDYYEGAIPAELARIVRDFCEERNITVQEARSNLFILAPTEMFQTIKHVPLRKDPILLYRDAEVNTSSRGYDRAQLGEMFVQVYNWGNDFTITRRFRFLLGTIVKKEGDSVTLTATIVSALLFLASFLIGVGFFNIAFPLIFFILGAVLLFINANVEKYADTLWNTNEN